MFDWDKDYDELVTASVIVADPVVAAPAEGTRLSRLTGRARAFASRWAMAGAVVLALGTAGIAALVVPPQAPARWLADVAAWTGAAQWLDDPTMPEGLLAYDQAQYDRFRHGIARFTDAELLDFARVTQRELRGPNVMAAYTQDALFLIQREIERRGLNRPTASLRDSFQRS